MNKYREPDIIFKWTNCCRLCLSQESTIDLFAEASISQHFPSKIRTCLNFLIYSGDPMPRKICATCCMKLDNWFQFRKECIQTEKDLRQRLQPYKEITFVKEYLNKYIKYEKSSQHGNISMDSMSEYDENESGDGEDDENEDMEVYSELIQKEDDENRGLSDNDRIISTNRSNSTKVNKANSEIDTIISNSKKENQKDYKEKFGNEIPKKIYNKRGVQVSTAKIPLRSDNTRKKTNNCFLQNKSNMTNLKNSVNNENRKISELNNLSIQEKNFKACMECDMDFPNEEVFALHSCNVIESGGESDDNDNFINPMSFLDTSLTEPVKESFESEGGVMEVEWEVAFKEVVNVEKKDLIKPWKCLICSDYFESILELKDHYQFNSDSCIRTGDNFDCEICKRKFNSKNKFAFHQLAHIKEIEEKSVVLVKCDSCDSKFDGEQQLKEHTCARVKKEIPTEMGGEYPCLKCEQIFPDKELLEKHELIHNQQDLYNLIVTPQFTTFEGIDEIENLTNENHYDNSRKPTNIVRCFRCGRIFSSAEELEQHEMLKHKNPTPYFCRKCDLRFSARSQLLMHVRNHMKKTTATASPSGNISDNTCEICNAKFFLQSDLQSHLKMHSFNTTDDSQSPLSTSPTSSLHKSMHNSESSRDNKVDLFARFKCSVCSKIFVHSGSIIRHGKNLHKGQTVYPLRLKRPIFLMKRARSLSLPNEKLSKSSQPPKPLTSSNAVTRNSQHSLQDQFQEHNFDNEGSQGLKWDQDQNGMKFDGNIDFGTEKCPFCEKFFKPTYLPRHIKRNHRGEVLDPQMLGKEMPDDSLICRYCLKSCSNPHNRRVHESIHYPVKMQCNQCKICAQKFFSKASYEVHILSCKSVRCGKCNKIFFRYLSLKNHSCVVTLTAETKP